MFEDTEQQELDWKVSGVSLMEILVVIVIIGIIAAIAIPRFMNITTKAKTIEAKNQLLHLYTLQKTYFLEYSKYSEDPAQVGFEQTNLVSDGGDARYLIEMVQVSGSSFLARATAVVDFDGDGVINVWEIDQEKNLIEVTPD